MKTTSILLALSLAPAAFPQETAQTTIPVIVTKYKVKPGETLNFEAIIQKHKEAWQKEGRAFFLVWRPYFGESYEFITMAATPGIQSLDGPSILAKAHGEAEALHLGYRMAQCAESITRQLWHIHPEQSMWSAQDFRFARVVESSLRGQSVVGDYTRAQTRIAAKTREAGRKNQWILHLDYGGDDYRVLDIVPFDKIGDVSTISLTRLMGADEGKKLLAMREQATVSRSIYIWRTYPSFGFRKDDLFQTK